MQACKQLNVRVTCSFTTTLDTESMVLTRCCNVFPSIGLFLHVCERFQTKYGRRQLSVACSFMPSRTRGEPVLLCWVVILALLRLASCFSIIAKSIHACQEGDLGFVSWNA